MTQISNNPRKLETTRATKNKSSDKTLSMFKKKKPAPVDVGSLVKKSSYTRGWLTDYNALRKEETFAEGVFLRHSRTNAGRVVFSLSELPQGDVWLTANNTPLERVSASEVKIGDHTVQSAFGVEWQRLDPLDLEIRPVRRRIDRVDVQLRRDMGDSLDELVSALFIDRNDRAAATARRTLQRINQECSRELKEMLSAIGHLEKNTVAAGGVRDVAINTSNTKKAAEEALKALDRANAALKLRSEVGDSRRELKAVFTAFEQRLRDFARRQAVIDNPRLSATDVAEQVEKRVATELKELGRNDMIGLNTDVDDQPAKVASARSTRESVGASPRPGSAAPAPPSASASSSSTSATSATATTSTSTSTSASASASKSKLVAESGEEGEASEASEADKGKSGKKSRRSTPSKSKSSGESKKSGDKAKSTRKKKSKKAK